MSVRQLRGYGLVVALAAAFLTVSTLTVPARRLQLTVGDSSPSPAAGGGTEAAAPPASGQAAWRPRCRRPLRETERSRPRSAGGGGPGRSAC